MLSLQTAATTLAVSVADQKSYMRVTHSDEDTLIQSLIEAATAHAEFVTGRATITQTWKLTLPSWPEIFRVPMPPLQSVSSLKYVDAAGTLQTLTETTDYVAYTASGTDRGLVGPAYGKSWPSARSVPDAVQLTFVAGWDSAASIPDNFTSAIKLLAAHWYENREGEADIPMAVDRILAAHKCYGFGGANG